MTGDAGTALREKRNGKPRREGDERFRKVFDEAPIGMTLAGRDYRFVKANAAFCEMIGYTEDELKSLTFRDITHPQDAFASIENVQKLTAGELPKYYTEKRYLRRDGTVIWAALDVTTFRDDRGEISLYYAIVVDITARKRAETGLKESERRFRTLVKNLPGMVYRCMNDRDWTMLYVSEGAQPLTGYAPAELTGRARAAYGKLIVPEDRGLVWENVQRSFAGRSPFTVTYRIRTRDGSVRWVWEQGRGVFDEDGRLMSLEGFITDITERKYYEFALQNSNRKLNRALESTLETISTIIETRDPFTAGHQKRVAVLAVALAREMGMPASSVDCIRVAALLHDAGKIHVPGEILCKPGVLSEVELRIVKSYPEASYEILKRIDYPLPVADVVLQHQERYDGSGYPEGLSGEQILPEARVLAVADVIEAMTAHRPYRTALGIEAAMQELRKNKGVRYDPRVIDACERLFIEKKYNFGEINGRADAVERER